MRDFLYGIFLPHPKNNHKASLLRTRSLFLLSLFFIAGALFFSSPANPISKGSAFADVSIIELINLTNQKRSDNNLPLLVSDKQLNAAAAKKADDMFDKNYWAHNSPDGVTPWVFIKSSGYEYVYAGENLARGFNNANDVIGAWMASPSHRENMLSPNYEDVGFAVRTGMLNGEETILVVQEFGSKNASSAVEPAPKVKENSNLIMIEPLLASINNLTVSDNLVIIFLLVLVLLLIMDIFMIEQKKIIRFTGHNEDHIMYVVAIIIIIFLMTAGAII